MIKEKSSYASSITYFLMVILFVTLRMLANYGVLDFLAQNEVVADVVLSCFIQIGIMFSMSLFAYSLIKKQKVKTTFKQFGFKKISFKAVLICILMGFCIFFINILVSSFFNGIISGLGY